MGAALTAQRISITGRLVVTRFDRKGITGTFSFKTEQRDKTGKKVDVNGSFSYACTGEACQK